MATVTLKLITPSGAPVDLALDTGDDGKIVAELLDRTDKLASALLERGYAFADAAPAGPSVAELTAGPTFCGYACSPGVNAAGFPTWILADGQQAQRREKQGDVWYSVKLPDGQYERKLHFRAGEQVPAVAGLAVAQ